MHIRITYRSISGAILLMVSWAQAQNLFVSGSVSGNIYEFTPDGRQSTFASGLDSPTGLTFDRAGNLFVGALTNIYEFKPDGTESNFASLSGGAAGLAFNSAGDLFVSQDTPGGGIIEITPEGTRIPFASALDSPVGIAFNSAGDLFVADSGSGNIYEFTTNGVKTTFASGLVYPYALAFDRSGDLFVVNGPGGGPPNWGSIYEFTTNGVQSTFASGLGSDGLAFNSAGDLFAPDANTNILEFTPGGAQSTFASGFASGLEIVDGLAWQPEPELQGIVTNGVFQITVTMPSPYYSTIIQVSTNLVNWVNIYTNTPPFTLTNSMATTSACLYRAVLGR